MTRSTGGSEPSRIRADGGAGTVASSCAALGDPGRLQALVQLGLLAESDPRMEGYAQWVRDSLGVPVVLVSLVGADSQVFPGMVGLTGRWARQRSTPLTHSFCQHVVQTARPLIVADAREHPLVRDNLAVPDLGVIAYAGMPLTDQDGLVLGSLCAIDHRPRAWTDTDLRTLARIADACSTDLRLRLSRFDHTVEDLRRDALERGHDRAYDRSQTLLHASQQFSDAATVDEVAARVRGLVTSSLRPTVITTVLVGDDGRVRRWEGLDATGEDRDVGTEVDDLAATTAIREARIVHHPDRRSFDAASSPEAAALLRRLGLHTTVAVPLPGPEGPIGAIAFGWPDPAAVDATDLLTLASIAGYAAQAIRRAEVLAQRVTVAHDLQNAMLTTLPVIAGLDMAARYAPADSREHVGGDWYDAACLPAADHTGSRATVSVGDIIGHTLDAAMIMGQARSMLRQAAWDHPGGTPTAVLQAFETADLGLGLGAAGTAVIAHLHDHGDGTWSMTWTNAGHPPPILIGPDGTTELLDEHGPLFGFSAVMAFPRLDHFRDVPPGSTLFLYTDGLVEHRVDHDIDAGIEALQHLLCDLHHQPVQHIVDTAVDTLAPDAPDDVVAFAIRFPPAP